MSGEPGSLLRRLVRDGILPPAPDMLTEQLEEAIAASLVDGQIPVAFSLRPLTAGEWVRHGDGIMTHSGPNEHAGDELLDEILRWQVGADVPAAGLLLWVSADGKLETR